MRVDVPIARVGIDHRDLGEGIGLAIFRHVSIPRSRRGTLTTERKAATSVYVRLYLEPVGAYEAQRLTVYA
jgi:hypothetical protein